MSFIVVSGKILENTFKVENSYTEVHKTYKAAQKQARELSMKLKKQHYVLELKEVVWAEIIIKEKEL